MYRAYKLIGEDLNPRRFEIASFGRRVRRIWPCTFVRAGQDRFGTQEMVVAKVGFVFGRNCYSAAAGLGGGSRNVGRAALALPAWPFVWYGL